MKRHMWGRLVIVALIILFILPSLSPAQMIIERINEAGDVEKYELKYCVTFSKDDLIFGKLMGYDTVELKDGTCINDVGKPMMPAMEIKIALPAGMAVKQVRVVETKAVDIKGKYTIFPAQPPRRIDGSDDDAAFIKPDIGTYTSTRPYPSQVVDFVHQTDLAGQGMAVIHLFPVQYIPVEKKLTLYTSITFVITGFGGYKCGDYLSSERYRETYAQRVKEMVVNPEDVEVNTYPDPIPISLGLPPGGPYDHVIIASSTYEAYWAPLVEWHTKRGLKDTVVTTNYIYTNYGGSDNQEKIRNFIIDAHGTWGTQYVLMAGENPTPPFEYRNYYQNVPSDQYYSDYDDDWTHEVYVGRSTAQGSTQINTFINKVINYETDPPLSNYILDVLLIGMDADDYTEMQYMKDDIDGYIPSRFDVTKVYDSHGGNHKTAVINALNDGQHLVNHADHGYMDYMGTGDRNHGLGIYNGDVDALTNDGKPSIVATLACLVNKMTHSDSISEHFVIYNPNQAGLAFTGNTGNGLYYEGDDSYPYYLSNKLDYWWWRSLFDNDKYIIGETLAHTKHNFGTDPWNPDAGRHCVWEFNLLGEPAMPIWTDTPESLTATYDLVVGVGSQDFDVHVEDSSGNLQGATVCLWKGDEVYEVDETDYYGDADFTINPSTLGTMYVTVTKHNYLPYEGSNEVQFTIEGEIFESNGITPVNDPEVTITNIGTGEEWTDVVELGTNDYSLLLDVGTDINLGDTLRVMAKKTFEGGGEYDPDGYTYSIHVEDREIYQADIDSGGIFDFDLNLDHYCINYFPDYPYHIKEQETYSGAAVMQMWTDFKSVGLYVQDDLQTWGLSNNTDEDKTAGLQYIDPRGMAITLRGLVGDTLPPGHTFVVGVMPGNTSGLNWAMHRICWWQYTGPGALPTGGNYEDWMSVRGIHTDKRPQDGQYAGLGDWGYDVYGFWINDPDDQPTSIGENSYKTADEWTSTYYTMITDPYNTNWDGKYITVLEPPPEGDVEVTIVPAKPRFTKAITPIMMAKPVRIWGIEKTVLVETIRDKEALDVVKAAIGGVTEELLPYDQDFAETFAKTIAGEPLYVKDNNGDYYIVPFNIPMQKIKPRLTKCVMFERMGKGSIELVRSIDENIQIEKIPIKPIPKTRTLIVVIVDVEDGHFKEASWVTNPAQYLPISEERALEIVFESVKSNVDLKYVRDITIELVHRDSNPYYPDWKITIKNRVFYVGQDGTVS